MIALVITTLAAFASAKVLFSPESFAFNDGQSPSRMVMVKLDHKPTSDVIISLNHDDLHVSPCQLKFTPSTWNVTQEVKVTAAFPWNKQYSDDKMIADLTTKTEWTRDTTFTSVKSTFRVTRNLKPYVACKVVGDPHFIDFDGSEGWWHEEGGFLMGNFPDFQVQTRSKVCGRNEMNTGDVSCSDAFSIQYNGAKEVYHMVRNEAKNVTELKALRTAGFKKSADIKTLDYAQLNTIRFELGNGAIIIITTVPHTLKAPGWLEVEIGVSSRYLNNVGGICGPYDGIRNDNKTITRVQCSNLQNNDVLCPYHPPYNPQRPSCTPIPPPSSPKVNPPRSSSTTTDVSSSTTVASTPSSTSTSSYVSTTDSSTSTQTTSDVTLTSLSSTPSSSSSSSEITSIFTSTPTSSDVTTPTSTPTSSDVTTPTSTPTSSDVPTTTIVTSSIETTSTQTTTTTTTTTETPAETPCILPPTKPENPKCDITYEVARERCAEVLDLSAKVNGRSFEFEINSCAYDAVMRCELTQCTQAYKVSLEVSLTMNANKLVQASNGELQKEGQRLLDTLGLERIQLPRDAEDQTKCDEENKPLPQTKDEEDEKEDCPTGNKQENNNDSQQNYTSGSNGGQNSEQNNSNNGNEENESENGSDNSSTNTNQDTDASYVQLSDANSLAAVGISYIFAMVLI